jgi:hypothetical protein
MSINKSGDKGRASRLSEPWHDYPAGTVAHKARIGRNVESKQPNENGDLPNKPGGDVRT